MGVSNLISNIFTGTASIFNSCWPIARSWPLEVKIGLILSAIAAVGAVIAAAGTVKILWPKKAKPKLVKPELFISSGVSAKGALLFRCFVRNDGTKLLSVEKLEIKFDGDMSLLRGGCVNINSPNEHERYITSTKLPVIILPNATEQVVVVGYIRKLEERPSNVTINIEFGGETESITEVVKVKDKDIIESYGNIRK